MTSSIADRVILAMLATPKIDNVRTGMIQVFIAAPGWREVES